jgi:hypothetical protein
MPETGEKHEPTVFFMALPEYPLLQHGSWDMGPRWLEYTPKLMELKRVLAILVPRM